MAVALLLLAGCAIVALVTLVELAQRKPAF